MMHKIKIYLSTLALAHYSLRELRTFNLICLESVAAPAAAGASQ